MKNIYEYLVNDINELSDDLEHIISKGSYRNYKFAFGHEYYTSNYWFFMSNTDVYSFKDDMLPIDYDSRGIMSLYDAASWNVLTDPKAWIGICYNKDERTWLIRDFKKGKREANQQLTHCIENTIKYYKDVTWKEWNKFIDEQ